MSKVNLFSGDKFNGTYQKLVKEARSLSDSLINTTRGSQADAMNLSELQTKVVSVNNLLVYHKDYLSYKKKDSRTPYTEFPQFLAKNNLDIIKDSIDHNDIVTFSLFFNYDNSTKLEFDTLSPFIAGIYLSRILGGSCKSMDDNNVSQQFFSYVTAKTEEEKKMGIYAINRAIKFIKDKYYPILTSHFDASSSNLVRFDYKNMSVIENSSKGKVINGNVKFGGVGIPLSKFTFISIEEHRDEYMCDLIASLMVAGVTYGLGIPFKFLGLIPYTKEKLVDPTVLSAATGSIDFKDRFIW